MAKINRIISECLRVIKCKLSPRNIRSLQEENEIQELRSKLLHVEPEFYDKNIWIFWDAGLSSAPEVVQLSYQSWEKFNPDYTVNFLDNDSLKKLIGFDFFDIFKYSSVNLGSAGKSDLLRLYLLNRFGGVWADATTFCKKPISDWLDISETGFFCFREKHASDRQLVSWFLASNKNHPVISELLERSFDYLMKFRQYNLDVRGLKSTYLLVSQPDYISKSGSGYKLLNDLEGKYCTPYFWMFYLFNETLIDKSDIWDMVTLMDNTYAELNEDYVTFSHSLVSKQTYREKYIKSELYQERKKSIDKILKS